MTDRDYSKEKGVADEPHWNRFVQSIGGELVAPLITRKDIKNADYIFRDEKFIVELKIFETEFAHAREMMERVKPILSRANISKTDFERAQIDRELMELLKKPIQRIVNKANRQIKETKIELKLPDYHGVIVCVNDEFRGVPPDVIIEILDAILNGNSYNNTHAIIYMTNHYVELLDNPYAVLLWHAVYKNNCDDKVVDFVDDLGRKWRVFLEAEMGPFDFNGETPNQNLRGASVVSGPIRNNRYIGK